MNSLYQLVASSALIIAVSQPALAIKAINAPAPVATPTAKTSVVERGGTVTGVDLPSKTITVDNIKYMLPTVSANIHAHNGSKNTDRAAELKAGMQIRFNTSKENFSAQQQIVEIWVTRLATVSPQLLK